MAVVAVAASAGFVGDRLWFWLGRRRGARIVAHWTSLAWQTERMHGLLQRWHAGVIIGVRFA